MGYMCCLKQAYRYLFIWFFVYIHLNILRGILGCRHIGVYVCMRVAAFMIAKQYMGK